MEIGIHVPIYILQLFEISMWTLTTEKPKQVWQKSVPCVSRNKRGGGGGFYLFSFCCVLLAQTVWL